jgi:hypothetical protein
VDHPDLALVGLTFKKAKRDEGSAEQKKLF